MIKIEADENDAENGGEIHVELPAAPEPEPVAESSDVVVVNSGDSSGAVDAEVLRQLAEVNARNAELSAQLDATRATAETALATAEGTDAILAAENDIEQSRIDAVEEQLAEVASAAEPEDSTPNNTHWAFRSRDEWKGR